MKITHYFIMSAAIGVIATIGAGCNNNNTKSGQKEVYEAHLQALNSKFTGMQTSGEARFEIANDTMTVTIDVKNASPGMQHWQHFHGFANDSAAICATDADDKNGDGVVDVVETESASGTTMVPFNQFPAEMKVGSSTYPTADENGSYHYEAKVPMKQLKESFAKAFGGSAIDLDRRVLYIHGVPDNANLPPTAASIAGLPAVITLPIACGKINKVK